MLINLFQTIRSSGVPCTLRELLDLLGALENQLVYANIDDFYYLSRATLEKMKNIMISLIKRLRYILKALKEWKIFSKP